jgi:hypothetical protein
VQYLLAFVGAFVIACAAPRAAAPRVVTTPAERIAWLRTEMARAEMFAHHMHGAYFPKTTAGGAMVCSLAIEIDAWYGVTDDRWELTNASAQIRAELARIGIRDCVLDLNR